MSDPGAIAAGPFDRLLAGNRSALRLGIAALVASLVGFALIEATLRAIVLPVALPPQSRDLRIALVLCALFAFALAAAAAARDEARQCLRRLRAELPDDEAAFERRVSQLGVVSRRGARRAGVCALGLVALVPLVVDRSLPVRTESLLQSPEMIFHRLFGPLLAWTVGRTAHGIWSDAGRVSFVACDLRSLDLLDLSSLAPLGRYGLRVSLLAIGFLAIAAVLVTDQGLTEVVLLGLLPATLLFATAGLLRPAFGARRRIRTEKARELRAVRAAIAGDTGALVASPLAARRDSCSLADLLAFEARVDDVAEWPFDAPTLLRFALGLLVPLGSWLGGAVAQLAIERAIG